MTSRWLNAIGVAGALVGALLFAAVPTLAADVSTNVVQLRWQRGTGAENCPEQPRLEQLVRQRLERDPFAADAARTIEASVSAADGTWHVELHVRDGSGPSLGQRIFDVRADSCAKVVDAVGLAVALAIDPNASLKVNPSAPELEPVKPNTADGAPADAAKPDAAGQPKVVPPLYPYAQLLAPVEPACPVPSPWKTRVALRGVLAAGLLPGAAPGAAVAGSFDHVRSHLLLGISHFAEAARGPGFAFGLTTVDLGYCHDIVRSQRWELGGCADVHAGAQHVVVKQLVPLQQAGEHPFAAAGLGPRFSWVAWAPLYLEAGVSAWVPFLRPSFYISRR